MVTWVLFAHKDGKWEFKGFTPHDELVSEFEEMAEEEGYDKVETFCLEG